MTDAQPFEWSRILLGGMEPLFALEFVFRTVVIFAWLLLLLRLTGKRSVAQLGPMELALVIAMGSAAGDPMFYPEVPLLYAMLVLALVVGMHRVLVHLIRRSESVETALEGVPLELVNAGTLNHEALKKAHLSREDVFEFLRNQEVRQLGEVQRAYLEQNGTFSVFRLPPEQAPAGLPVVPPWDIQKPPTLPANPEQNLVCMSCGASNQGLRCACPGKQWTRAVHDPLSSPRAEDEPPEDAENE